ncbi:MAG TPA: SH3 domain-containing protein [Caldilineaceae bacterium]|nr:SH3 domain-containing protein [Caldilineaceae bacterium]
MPVHRIHHLARSWPARVLFALSLLWLAPTLACGSFAPRPTPTPTNPVVVVGGESSDPTVVGTPAAPSLAEQSSAAAPTETPTLVPTPTATFTPTAQPGTALAVGQPARVVAPAGLNMRQEPRAGSELILQLGTGIRVTILAGPQTADNFTWWQVDDGNGNVGWVAERDDTTEWLSPQLGQAQPANRAPRVGDRVQVTTAQLSIRAVPGTDGALVAQVDEGRQFTITAGPQQANGYTWYQIRSDDGAVEGWAADGDGSSRWLSPLE